MFYILYYILGTSFEVHILDYRINCLPNFRTISTMYLAMDYLHTNTHTHTYIILDLLYKYIILLFVDYHFHDTHNQ